MALIWTESAQRIRTTAKVGRAYFNVESGNWSATAGRDGGPAYTGGGFKVYPVDPAPSGTKCILGMRVKPAPTANGVIFIVGQGLTGDGFTFQPGVQVALHTDATGKLQVRNGVPSVGSILGETASGFVSAGTLYYITMEVDIDASDGAVNVWVDGVLVEALALTGVNTDPRGSGGWDSIQFGAQGALTAMCDMYCLDGTNPSGDDPHEPILDARVDYIQPDGTGYVSDFTGSDSNQTDNYLLVDENDPDDDSTYVERTDAGKDAYTLGAVPVEGATVIGVTTIAHARKSDAGVAVGRTGLRIGGTDYMQTNNKALPVSYAEYRHHWGHDPSNGAWSESVFNNAELVIEKV